MKRKASDEHGNVRLAKGQDGKERPWLPEERVMLYKRGFRDGACALQKRHQGLVDYECGYEDGHAAVGKAVALFADKIGHDPRWDILRGKAP